MNPTDKLSIHIGDKIISKDSPTFIIAEAGVNHGGDMNLAKELVDIAAEAGADAVKFQAFKTENLILENVDKANYQQKTTDHTESQYDMLKKLEISTEQNLELKAYCDAKNIIFLTTPFDEGSLEDLDSLDLLAYKIASTDTTNIPFLKKIAAKQKPVFLSTGMTYLAEVEQVIREILPINQQIVILQCTANYPIVDEEANLAVINTYKEKFPLFIGYSDHSVGIGASPYAVAMGAKVVEKHFTLDKDAEGPDHLASLSPSELSEFVKTVRQVEKYLGTGIKKPTFSEIKNRQSLQKCFVANQDIAKGEQFTEQNIIAKRTGGKGISPLYYQEVLQKTAHRDFKKNEIIEVM